MGIVVIGPVIILNVRVHGLIADGTRSIVDLIAGVDEISVGKSWILCKITGVIGCLSLQYATLKRTTARLSCLE